ncbi:6-phosphogluconate dehydrogenase,decarboxylating [Candidatus Paraburkholderia kirkii UZHbot1]|uniref:6-phosphogluconate dehydrogenase, decarboxylating n=1 Tax=Candidatus Paraburkholderia kirkii UZHbot1 TaxID=1055526 RepID=G4MI67_9BURK|nr:6-phosphogluconate dehydrogenase,decarboxylating [Candidatus Paraburkholderia kirkii UZHbot1]
MVNSGRSAFAQRSARRAASRPRANQAHGSSSPPVESWDDLSRADAAPIDTFSSRSRAPRAASASVNRRSSMSKQAIGVVGLAVMGRNLALNIESCGHAVSVYNRSRAKTDELIAEHPDKKLVPTYTLEEFVASLEKPRRILMMVKAGAGTDETIAQLRPLLEKGDILIDGGNTHFTDTIRRNQDLAKSGLHFIGTGVSGGEEGALKGPSIMPGGQKETYELVAPILTEIAAKAPDGEPCVAYMGPDGAGHFVKMVHNGIEYGDMQLIAESYDVLKRVAGLSNEELGKVYVEWNQGELDSYLIEITSKIFSKKDEETGKDLVDVILDRAAQKGTGKWTSQNALDLGAPLPLITEAVFARVLSSLKTQRVAASKVLTGPAPKFDGDRAAFVESVRRALYLSKIVSYAQGFAQLRAASDEYNWDLHYGEIAKIFRAGCIIRARFLQKITDAYKTNPDLANLLLDPYFSDIAAKYQDALREVVVAAVKAGIPVPVFSSAIAYFDGYQSERLPANLVQAQRDFFGAHTFERTDKQGSFHANWA